MDWNNDQIVDREKTKLSTKFGCFFGIVILMLLIILVPVWFYFSYPDETQLKVSHSPNNVNIIQIVKKDDFPNPTLRIYYGDEYISRTKLPDNISVEWENDYEADVILTRQGREPDIVKVKFND